jgi:hypothetical protein
MQNVVVVVVYAVVSVFITCGVVVVVFGLVVLVAAVTVVDV